MTSAVRTCQLKLCLLELRMWDQLFDVANHLLVITHHLVVFAEVDRPIANVAVFRETMCRRQNVTDDTVGHFR